MPLRRRASIDMTRVLVTGASGFIGRHLIDHLGSRGYALGAVFARASKSFPADVETFEVGDVRNPDPWRPVQFSGADAVVHLAARAHITRETASDASAEFYAVNVAPAISLFQACVKAGVPRFIFVSSIGVNGNITRTKPFSDSDQPAPSEPYAVSKWQAEQALHGLSDGRCTQLTIVRPALVYGRSAKGNFRRLMQLVRSGWPVPLATTENRRNFLHVQSLCNLIEIALTHPGAVGRTFLAADQQSISTAQLIELMACSMHRNARILRVPRVVLLTLGSMIGQRPEVERLLGSLEVDSTSARTSLDWDNSRGPADGIPEMVRSFLSDPHAQR